MDSQWRWVVAKWSRLLAAIVLLAAVPAGQVLGRSPTVSIVGFLSKIVTEQDCVADVTILDSQAMRFGYSIATKYTAKVNRLIIRGTMSGIESEPGAVRFLTEGGRLGEEIAFSEQSVYLEPNKRYCVFLRQFPDLEVPVLLDRRLIGHRQEDGQSFFNEFQTTLDRNGVAEAVGRAKLQSETRRCILSRRMEMAPSASPDGGIEFAMAPIFASGPPNLRAVGEPEGIIVQEVMGENSACGPIARGSTIPIDLPASLRSIPRRELLLFLVKNASEWQLAKGEYAIWQRIGDLYHPITLQGRKVLVGDPGLSSPQIRESILSSLRADAGS